MKFPDATWIPSPNFGYPRGTHGQLKANISSSNGGGEFWHSQQGRQSVAIAMFQNPALQVSAHFLFPKVGKPVQMVDSNDAAWHAAGHIKNDPLPGGPGVGSLANLYFHGFEFEGGPPGNLSEALTSSQITWGVRVTLWLRKVHNSRQMYVLKETEWEHNWVTATACPSGRIPWVRVISALRESEQEDDMPVFFRKSNGAISVATAQGKRHINSTEWAAWRKAGATHTNVTDAQYNAVPNYRNVDAGLARGIVQAIGTGAMSGAMRLGDATWKPPKDLRDVIAAIKPQTQAAINAYGGKFRQWCREAIVSTGIKIPDAHNAILAAITGIQAGSGLTFNETKQAVKDAGKEGTG